MAYLTVQWGPDAINRNVCREIVLTKDIAVGIPVLTACLITDNQFVFTTADALLRRRNCRLTMLSHAQLSGGQAAQLIADIIMVDLTDMEKPVPAAAQILPPTVSEAALTVIALSPYSQEILWPTLTAAGYHAVIAVPFSTQRFFAAIDPIVDLKAAPTAAGR